MLFIVCHLYFNQVGLGTLQHTVYPTMSSTHPAPVLAAEAGKQ